MGVRFLLCFFVFGAVFFVGASVTEVHQLPNGGIADTFNDFSILDLLNGCRSFKAQISTVKADELSERSKRFGKNIHKAGLVDVAVTVIDDAVFFSSLGGILIDDFIVDGFARLFIDVSYVPFEPSTRAPSSQSSTRSFASPIF